MRLLLVSCLFIGGVTALPIGAEAKGFPCHWVDGRMTLGNGNPAFRIWPRGTKRLLGVVGRDGYEPDDLKRLPPSLRRLSPRFGRVFWGQFRFCPTTSERAGWMRFGYVTAARRIVVVDY